MEYSFPVPQTLEALFNIAQPSFFVLFPRKPCTAKVTRRNSYTFSFVVHNDHWLGWRGVWGRGMTLGENGTKATVETPNNGECQTEKSVSEQRTDKTSSSLPKSCNIYHGRSKERTNQRLLKEPFRLVFCNQSLFLLCSKQSCLTFLQLLPNPLIWGLFFSGGHVICRETTASWA